MFKISKIKCNNVGFHVIIIEYYSVNLIKMGLFSITYIDAEALIIMNSVKVNTFHLGYFFFFAELHTKIMGACRMLSNITHTHTPRTFFKYTEREREREIQKLQIIGAAIKAVRLGSITQTLPPSSDSTDLVHAGT